MQNTKARNTSHDPFPWALTLTGLTVWTLLYRSLLPFWDQVIYGVLHQSENTPLGRGVHFFFYDTSKILLLLTGMIFTVSVIRSFFTIEKTRLVLGGKRQGTGNLLAALLGVLTPFCSCSAVPVFIGFVSSGIPLGVTLSFLIASPMVNEVAVVMLYGMFGMNTALLYVLMGLTLAMLAGWVLGKMRLERHIEGFVLQAQLGKLLEEEKPSWKERYELAASETGSMVIKILPYLLIGIGLGAALHGWVPADLIVRYAGNESFSSVLMAVLIGVPLYSNAAGILPLIEVLYHKGLPMGTLLSFMMAVVALSLPELVLLRRVLQPPLLFAFVLVVTGGILITGLIFNALL